MALATALRRGELLALRWQDVELLDGRLQVRQAYVRGEFQAPKSSTSRRTLELGPRAVGALREAYEESRYRAEDELVFCHPALGTPLDPSKLARDYMRPALARAKITKPFRPWHDLRHTSLTHEAAAGNPQAYVQLQGGALAGHDHRAVHPRGAGAVPRCREPWRGAHLRRRPVAIPVATSPTVRLARATQSPAAGAL